MLGLLALGIAENIVDMRNDIFWGFVKRLAHRVLICIALGLAISFPSFSEAAAFQERQGTFKAISFNGANSTDNWGKPFSFLKENFSQRLSDFVEVFSPIAPKRQAVAENDAKAKSNNSDDYTLLQCLLPIITFAVGFLISYEPERRDKKRPNARLTGATPVGGASELK